MRVNRKSYRVQFEVDAGHDRFFSGIAPVFDGLSLARALRIGLQKELGQETTRKMAARLEMQKREQNRCTTSEPTNKFRSSPLSAATICHVHPRGLVKSVINALRHQASRPRPLQLLSSS